jgi:NADPH-dependent 2,4-dienoyl-CoA reductase/sulfur reductase-like enzyme
MNKKQLIVEAALALHAAGKQVTFEAIAPIVGFGLRTVVKQISAAQLREEMRAEVIIDPAKCYRLAVEIEAERLGYAQAWGRLLCR